MNNKEESQIINSNKIKMAKIKWYQRINPFFWLDMAMSECIRAGVYKLSEDILYDTDNFGMKNKKKG